MNRAPPRPQPAEPPEHQAVGREEQQAPDLQRAERKPPAGPDIEGHGHAHQDGDRDVDVGQVDGPVAVEEQGIAGRLAGHRARHRQEQVGEDRPGASQLVVTQVQHPPDGLQHAQLSYCRCLWRCIRFTQSHGRRLPPPVRAHSLARPHRRTASRRGGTALLMFLYSFLAMTSYNIVKPVTRSQFISSLGADNLPWVQFGAGMLIGVLMQGYTKAIAAVPRRWAIPVTQAGMIVLLVDLLGALHPGPSRVGLGRVLSLRPDSRHPAHQPVLDAGQRRLRPAAGQAAVRVDRRRRQPGRRHRRGHHRHAGPVARHHDDAARERGDPRRRVSSSSSASCAGTSAPAPATPPRPGRKRASAAARRWRCCAARATCRSSRWSSPSPPSAPRSSSSSSTWPPPRPRGSRTPTASPSSWPRSPSTCRSSACSSRSRSPAASTVCSASASR